MKFRLMLALSIFFSLSASATIIPDIPTRQLIIEGTCDRIIRQIDMPFTVSLPGTNCLAESVTGAITIATDGAILDLNGHTISGGTNGVIINNGISSTIIRNGIIGPVSEDGILANPSSSNITIENVKIINCGTSGINLDQSHNSIIENCDLTLNTTGLTLDNSFKNSVVSCRALCNILAGYSLLSSTTNIFKNCEALSTGEGSTGQTTDVFGFRSFNGFGNVFESCIANSTQALTTTGADNVAAGFVLAGTEACSKIVNCEAANAVTNATGLAIPYGILLPSTFDSLTTNTDANHRAQVNSVNWSPDGRFLATGGNLNPAPISQTRVYQFNGTGLVEVAFGPHGSAPVHSVAWSPDGKFLAMGANTSGSVNVRVYSFNGKEITSVATADHGASINSVAWSSDGTFLALGSSIGAGVEVRVYRFTGTALISVATAVHGDSANSVDWSPDGKFLAIGGNTSAGLEIRVYEFSGVGLTQVATAAPGADVSAVNWSPDGKFLAIGKTGSANIRVYSFNGTALTEVASTTQGLVVLSVDWSPDGKFLAGGALSVSGTQIVVHQFTRTALTAVSTIPFGGTVFSVDWSPDGSYLATGGEVASLVTTLVLNALDFPMRNLLKNNVVYCNVGNECPAGVGISGSSLKNCIIGNSAYENVKNYEFLTNVVNEEFNTLSLNPAGIEALLNASCNELNLE